MDKFNDTWKNRFNEGDTPVGEWNTPDAEVWDAILPHAPVKKDRPWLFFFILGVSLLGIGAFGYVLLNQNPSISENPSFALSTEEDFVLTNNDEVSTDWPSQKQEATNILKQENQTISTAPVSAITKPVDRQVKVSQRINNNQVSTKNIANSSVIEKTEGRGFVPQSMNDKMIQGYHLQVENPVLDRTQNGSIILIKPKHGSLPEPLSQLPTKLSLIELEPFVLSKGIKELRPKQKRWSLGLNTGVIFWQHKISSAYQDDLEAFDFNYSDETGWTTGLSLQFEINDYLGVNAALQYENIKTSSGHNSNLQYDQSLEADDNSNDYELSLATPYGLSGASFRFERNNDIANEQVDLLVDFKSAHTIQNLSLPIGVEVFPIGRKQRWVPTVAVGFGLNYLRSISNDIHSIDTNHSAIQYEKGLKDSRFENPDITKLHFDLRLGAGLGYHINNKLQISLNANWSKGLNPIFEQAAYSTKINRYRLSLGINKRF